MISVYQAVYLPFSYLNDSICFTMRVSAIKSRHCIYHGRQCTVDRRSYSVLNMVRNFWNMCSTVEDDMWCITSIQLGITCHGSMTILKESNDNERPLSPWVLTHTPPLVLNPFSLGSVSPLFQPLNLLVLITRALHTPKWFHYNCLLYLTQSLLLTTFYFHKINSSLHYFLPAHQLNSIPPSLLSFSPGSYPWLSCCFPKSSLLPPTSLCTSSLIVSFQPPLLLSILALNFSQYWDYSFIPLANHSFSCFDS